MPIDMLGARRLEEQRLGARVHGGIFEIVDHGADLLANWRSPRVARGQHIIAQLA